MTSTFLSVNDKQKQKKKLRKNALDPVDFNEEKKNDPKFKTELCKTFSDTNFCPYGNRCRFAHGKNELFQRQTDTNKYKMRICNSFEESGFCIYGIRCNFKHGEKKLEELDRSYYNYLLLLKYGSANLFGNLKDENLFKNYKNYNLPLENSSDMDDHKYFSYFNSNNNLSFSINFNKKNKKKFKELKRLEIFSSISNSNQKFNSNYRLNFNSRNENGQSLANSVSTCDSSSPNKTNISRFFYLNNNNINDHLKYIQRNLNINFCMMNRVCYFPKSFPN
jgi:hypothetical protein